MSFTLRLVARRIAGGEIVRVRPIAAAEPVIGRGADCDIQLPDLAVGLRHARLRLASPGVVHVESVGGLGFEVGGRSRRSADLKLAAAPKIILGSHVLTLTAGEAPEEVVVGVARGAGAGRALEERDERAVFSPPAVVLGKRRLAWFLSLGILALCLGLPLAMFFGGMGGPRLHADAQWSSGPLSKAHGFLGGRCQACHRQAFVAVRDDACLACHGANRGRAAIARTAAENRAAGSRFAPALIFDHAAHDRLRAAAPLPPGIGPRIKAFFRRAFNHSDDRCASCHLEHLTADGRRPAVARIDGPPRDKPFLVAVHGCADCHGRLKERVAGTALLDVPDWGGHPDFRPRRKPPSPGFSFSHRLHLSEVGGVARLAQVVGPARGYGSPLACADCHRPDRSGRSFAPVEMKRDCAACHSLAFARDGGALRLLPHGPVAGVVKAVDAFYAARPPSAPASRADGRRVPGLAAEILQWWRRAAAPAAPSSQAARAVRAAFAANGPCANCHLIGPPRDPGSPAYIAPVLQVRRYMPRGRFDHGLPAHHQDARGRPTCEACHQDARLSDRAGDTLLPRRPIIAQCRGCHVPPKAKAKTVCPAPADCAECHSYHAPGAATPRPRDLDCHGRLDIVRYGVVGRSAISWARTPPPLLQG